MSFFDRGPTVPVLRLTGTIGMTTPLRPGITLSSTAGALERLFSRSKTPGVAIIVNSPGGSPVQSRLIYKRIRDLAEEKGKTVHVFIEDVGASGGYMLALAGDQIYADTTSIVGSIGVVSASFGFPRAMEKLGVERRVYTVGEHKMALDPFQDEKPDDVARLKEIQHDVHDVFTTMVRERRGSRLKNEGAEMFDGSIWSGRKALELGLIDGLGDVRGRMREIYGKNAKLRAVPLKRGWLQRRLTGVMMGREAATGGEDAGRTGLADDVLSTFEARALWARYGL